MKLNLKARLRNKAFVVIFATLIITFVYQILGMFDIVPSVSENDAMKIMSLFVNFLAGLGVLVDPTTPGVNDSERALTYYTDADVRDITTYVDADEFDMPE